MKDDDFAYLSAIDTLDAYRQRRLSPVEVTRALLGRIESLNPALVVGGVVMTMYDERTNLGQLVARDVREFFKEKVFNTIIPRNVRLAEAPSHGLPAVTYDPRSRGAEAYFAFATELLERQVSPKP